MKAEPADTQARAPFLEKGLHALAEITLERLGFSVLREHEIAKELLKRTHRFRAVDKDGLYSLAKDVARLTADSIDATAIQKIVPPPKGTRWSSLKSLENLVALRVDPQTARSMLGSLVGVYELRHGDAHLP